MEWRKVVRERWVRLWESVRVWWEGVWEVWVKWEEWRAQREEDKGGESYWGWFWRKRGDVESESEEVKDMSTDGERSSSL